MKSDKGNSVEILIKRTDNRQGWYLAYHPDEFFNVTYSLYFQDTIMGVIALQRFAEIIRKSHHPLVVVTVRLCLKGSLRWLNRTIGLKVNDQSCKFLLFSNRHLS